ncbi:MAG: hypothetical protein PHN25_00195 [Tissierellia bacterium]|jgi:hypothetical protein|nr:hypothetical protein [Tissierellia bacterium]MDD3751415.1 hypothetical protein [Tissierellia bacterium]MDD4677604.1 hypothetical protein [Tissierellia bacterium]
MKKLLAIVLIVAMSLFAFVACTQDQPVETPKTEEPKTEEPLAEGAVKTGLAVVSSIEKSKDAGEKDGAAQTDSVIVAVTIDNEGKIVQTLIDTAQTKIEFSKEGKILPDLNTVFKSKQELKEEYGMIKASTIDKEWYEQANALAEYVEGKTVEEVKGIAVDEAGVTTEADLVSSVTIKINPYKEAIEKAAANAQNLGADASDKLGLGVVTTISKSKDATADNEGLAQAYSTYTVATFDADGKVTSSVIDASQANVNFDAAGKITTDLSVAPITKVELGEDYGMKKASAIGKEWYEQADAFAAYVVGKTVEEIKGIAVDESGHATEEDLVSSVTVGIVDLQSIFEKAFINSNI